MLTMRTLRSRSDNSITYCKVSSKNMQIFKIYPFVT